MATEIWATFAYGGGTHPAGVPKEQAFLDAWKPWAKEFGATIKTTRFIAAEMLDHTSVTETAQYNFHRARAVTRFDKMMIDGGGSKTDPANYYDMDGLMLEFAPAGTNAMNNLYNGLLSEHVTFNAHWIKAELGYTDELAARNLTPDLLHYRTVYQPNIDQPAVFPAAYQTRHDDLDTNLGAAFYPLTLPRMGARAYILGNQTGDEPPQPRATVAVVESVGASNVAENARILATGSVTADIVPTIYLRYEGGSTPLFQQVLSDDLGVALMDVATDSMPTGGFAVWHQLDLGTGTDAELAKIKAWGAISLTRFRFSTAINRTPDVDTDIDRTPDATTTINRTPDVDTDIDRTPDVGSGVIDRTPDFDTERI